MDPQIGGMGRSDYQTWLPSNILVPKATAGMSPAMQETLKNRKITRQPSPLPNSDGAHMDNGSLYVARSGAGRPYPSDADQVSLTRHELLHALSREHPAFSPDLSAGLPMLRQALAQSGWGVPPALENDPDHLWTGAAEATMDYPAPPALRSYFSQLLGR